MRQLVEEIRANKYHVSELELIMVDESDAVIGYVMFSRFHIEGKYENELLMLPPVAVKTQLQRQHISKDLLEYGFEKEREMGFKELKITVDCFHLLPGVYQKNSVYTEGREREKSEERIASLYFNGANPVSL